MKNMYKIVVITFSVLLFNSCESFIDLKPLDRISTLDYWKTSRDLEKYMYQFYPLLTEDQQLLSDNAHHTDDMIHADISKIMNGERTISTGGWRGEWYRIRGINIFFENYQKCEDDFNSYRHYVGEAHFFRAWFYFNLLEKYGDLPWYSEVIELDDEEALMRPRDLRTMVADRILEDLDKAISYLDFRTKTGNSRISKEAALAFKTRVALYEGTWQKYHANTPFGTAGANPNKYFQECVDAAEELINGNYTIGIYSTGNSDKDYYQLFGFDNMSDIDEVILYKSFNAAEGFGNSAQYHSNIYPAERGITWWLISSYLGKNGEPYNYIEVSKTKKGNDFLNKIANDCDPRLKSTVWMPGDLMSASYDNYFDKPPIDQGSIQLCPTGFQVKKSSNPNSPAAGRPFEVLSETGYIILRYGEVLLNYAEAKYELENTVAYEQLNMLRERAGMPDFVVNIKNSDPNLIDYGYPVSDELYEIRRERRVEMAIEGLRDDDLMRWAAHSLFKGKKPKGYPLNSEEFPAYNKPIDANGLIDYYAKDMPNGYQFREGQDYLYSIPQNELTLNPNLTQNPGW